MNELELIEIKAQLIVLQGQSSGAVQAYWTAKVREVDHLILRAMWEKQGQQLEALWREHILPITGQEIEWINFQDEPIHKWNVNVLLKDNPRYYSVGIALCETFEETKHMIETKHPAIARVFSRDNE